MQSKSTPPVAPATTYPAIIGRVFGELRAKAGMTQVALADAVGITNSTWSRIERGESALSMDQFVVAARALKVLPSYVQICADVVAARVVTKGIAVEAKRWDVAPNAAETSVVALSSDALAPFVLEALGRVAERANPAWVHAVGATILSAAVVEKSPGAEAKKSGSAAKAKGDAVNRARKPRG